MGIRGYYIRVRAGGSEKSGASFSNVVYSETHDTASSLNSNLDYRKTVCSVLVRLLSAWEISLANLRLRGCFNFSE